MEIVTSRLTQQVRHLGLAPKGKLAPGFALDVGTILDGHCQPLGPERGGRSTESCAERDEQWWERGVGHSGIRPISSRPYPGNFELANWGWS